MISERPDTKAPDEAYVWIWLPGATEPVVAGRIARDGDRLIFNYGQSYLDRAGAIPIYEPELPLRSGAIPPEAGLSMAGCLRDAAPDAWGRRVILNRTFGRKSTDVDIGALDELTYLLESGSDRIGALDFQRSPSKYVPRAVQTATLEELLSAAEKVEKGIPLTPDLDQALFHGTSLGGARPKAMIQDGDQLTLTPAYDICPQSRSGNVANQAMLIVDDKRMSTLANCLEAAPHFQLDAKAAEDIVARQIGTIRDAWDDICEEADLTEVESNLLGQRIFLNPFIFEGAPEGLRQG